MGTEVETVRGHLNNARHLAYLLKVESANMSDELLAPEALRVCMEMAARLEAATDKLTDLWTDAQHIDQAGSAYRRHELRKALAAKIKRTI